MCVAVLPLPQKVPGAAAAIPRLIKGHELMRKKALRLREEGRLLPPVDVPGEEQDVPHPSPPAAPSQTHSDLF